MDCFKWLAHMKDRWDPEFKPSVEEITEYLRYLSSLSIDSEGFPYSVYVAHGRSQS